MPKINISVIIVLFLSVFVAGVCGYRFIEGWDWFDSFYMTVITLTTTGYGETHPLSTEGRIFTAFLLLAGMGIVAIGATVIMSWLLSFNMGNRRRVKMQNKISQLENHTIICGFGRMGKVVCDELAASGISFVVIEQSIKLLDQLKKTQYLYLEADAADDETLILAGVLKAKTLVSMIDNDHDAVFLSLAAKGLNQDIEIISRCNNESSQKKLKVAGSDRIVFPYALSGLRVAQTIINPATEAFVDFQSVEDSEAGKIQINDLHITASSSLKNKTLANCGFTRRELIVVGIKKEDQSFIFSPQADYHFEVGDCLIALGSKENYLKILDRMS